MYKRQPYYNFKKGEREYKGDFLKLGKEDILVIEGIHCLNDRLSYSLPRESKFKIYISALTQLNIDEHNRIPTTDGRLLRRMIRDARTRGTSARDTIRMWPSVRKGEEENIFPYQEEADAMFNSALIYELAVLKQYVEPLLFGIPKNCPEYTEDVYKRQHQAGFTNAVASLGTAFTSQHAGVLKRYTDQVILTYDSDGAGAVSYTHLVYASGRQRHRPDQ